MLHHACYMRKMARGNSGRIVVEVEPELKRRLYSALALSGSTLKDWLIKSANAYCSEAMQPSLYDHDQKNTPGPSINSESTPQVQVDGFRMQK